MKTALTVAGSDPSGGAGLQADLKVFRSFGIHGLAVVSAMTAQNSEGVDAVLPVDTDFVERQLHALLSDIKPQATKSGMLYKKTTVEIFAAVLRKYSLNNLVLDPVIVSTSGMSLVEAGTLDSMRDVLFPLSRVITPNIHEASLLSGITIENEKDMKAAVKELKRMGPEAVVITGGHLSATAADLYCDGEIHVLDGSRMEGEYHGTGCAFSSAVTALLALDYSPLEAAKRAKEFVRNAMEKAYHPGKGMAFLHI